MHLFLLVQTQWRSGGFGVIGLDYPAVFRVARLHGVRVDPRLFAKLQVLELATLKAVNAKPTDRT